MEKQHEVINKAECILDVIIRTEDDMDKITSNSSENGKIVLSLYHSPPIKLSNLHSKIDMLRHLILKHNAKFHLVVSRIGRNLNRQYHNALTANGNIVIFIENDSSSKGKFMNFGYIKNDVPVDSDLIKFYIITRDFYDTFNNGQYYKYPCLYNVLINDIDFLINTFQCRIEFESIQVDDKFIITIHRNDITSFIQKYPMSYFNPLHIGVVKKHIIFECKFIDKETMVNYKLGANVIHIPTRGDVLQ